MVCIYCGSPTQVTNSRKQRRSNNIWRRRACLNCGAIFTTHEEVDLSGALVVQSPDKHHKPQKFIRDKLFLSIYESCKHRSSAIADAAGLTDTIINSLARDNSGAIVTKEKLTSLTEKTLKRFDPTAAVFYGAYYTKK